MSQDTIRFPVCRSWNNDEDRESLYVELNLEDIRGFVEQIVCEKMRELDLHRANPNA